MSRSAVSATLHALKRVKAPATLAARVFGSLGLLDSYVRLPSAVGDVFVATGGGGVSAVRLARDDAAFEAWHARELGRRARRARAPKATTVQRLRRYVRGERARDAKVDLRGRTPFERAVLEKTREIPRGEVRPYAWIAREIGRPRAVRAVGTALGKNPVPLIIPCHRVVRSDGTAGSYVFGSRAKRALLASEGVYLPL